MSRNKTLPGQGEQVRLPSRNDIAVNQPAQAAHEAICRGLTECGVEHDDLNHFANHVLDNLYASGLLTKPYHGSQFITPDGSAADWLYVCNGDEPLRTVHAKDAYAAAIFSEIRKIEPSLEVGGFWTMFTDITIGRTKAHAERMAFRIACMLPGSVVKDATGLHGCAWLQVRNADHEFVVYYNAPTEDKPCSRG